MTSKKSGKSKSVLNVKFGKRLAALRTERKWTLTYMEQHSGLSESFLYEMEHGIKEPCLNTLDVLAKSFDMSMSELLKGV
jgi:transcriptional regulator with XRE-family HTH domain